MIHCDIKLCVGCRMCEVACSSGHFGAVSPALARIRVAKMDETGIDLASIDPPSVSGGAAIELYGG